MFDFRPRFRKRPRLSFVFLVASATSLSRCSKVGSRTTPERASCGFRVNFLTVLIGDLTTSKAENLDGDSIDIFWLEFWFEKPFEFWLEIP